MQIINSFPPNIEEISRFIPQARTTHGVIFAYGDRIYNPHGVPIPAEIIAHEEVHGRRQHAVGVEEWWNRYLRDIPFRYAEELVAHREEYRLACTQSRQIRRRALAEIAKRLASPLYGSLVSEAEARMDLQEHDREETVDGSVES